MFITLMPYSTSLLGNYLTEHGNQVQATAFYNGTLFLMALMYNMIWNYALKRGLIDNQCNPETVHFMTRTYLIGPLLFGVAFVVTFIWYPGSLILDILTNALFLLPSSKRPIYLPHQEHEKN
jgi:uncharacterized membrane protein